jgi:hypothetical protein
VNRLPRENVPESIRRQARAFHELPATLPASLIMSLTSRDLLTLYRLLEAGDTEMWHTTLSAIVMRETHKQNEAS